MEPTGFSALSPSLDVAEALKLERTLEKRVVQELRSLIDGKGWTAVGER